MGTVVSFAVLPAVPARGGQPAGRPDPATAIQAGCALLHEADAVFSTWDRQSPLSRLRRGDLAEADGPACLAEVRMACEAAREASGGWFDPWAMPGGYDPTGLVKGWAVGADEALAAVGGLPGYAGYLIRPDGTETWTSGLRFADP